MIRSDKKVQNLALVLKKEDNILISQAIELLREEPPFEGAISLLISFYNNNKDKAIKKSIETFMNDLKDPSAVTEVVAEIMKPYTDNTISMLVSSCWQSGLNYSGYSKDLVAIFLKRDYITAIECLTVIEESAHDLTPENKAGLVAMIKESQTAQIPEKKPLILEMISILER
jgi:hypothetical protein